MHLSSQFGALIAAPFHECPRNYFLNFVLPDRLDQAVALGIALQDIDGLVQIKLTNRKQESAGPSSLAQHLDRIGFGGGNWP